MESDFLSRNAAQRVIEGGDPYLRPLAAFSQVDVRVTDPVGDESRIVDLQQRFKDLLGTSMSRSNALDRSAE